MSKLLKDGVYHTRKKENFDHLMKRIEKEQPETKWMAGEEPTEFDGWSKYEGDTCVEIRDGIIVRGRSYHFTEDEGEIIPYVLPFSKKDMELGQPYLMRNGYHAFWDSYDQETYEDDLSHPKRPDWDVMEVYPMLPDSIWTRPEERYRLKGDLTREQAERLGLDLCEVIE